MPFTEIEIKRCEKAIADFLAEKRPPPEIRPQLDIDCRIENQSVIVFELRPQWRDPSTVTEFPCAKATYVHAQKVWKIYWQRADGKWHGYQPMPEVKTIDRFFTLVEEDDYGCFFG